MVGEETDIDALIGDIIYSDNLYKLRNDYMNCMQLSIIKEENKLSKM